MQSNRSTFALTCSLLAVFTVSCAEADGPTSTNSGVGPVARTSTPVTPEIAQAQHQARAELERTLPEAVPYLDAIIASGQISTPTTQTTSSSSGTEVVTSPLSWYCYPLMGGVGFWTAVAAVKTAKELGLLTSYTQCKRVVTRPGEAANRALFENNQALLATLVAIGTSAGVCACQYVM